MADPKWPTAENRSLIGKRIDRLDGPEKTTGRAQYSYDVNLPNMLWARLLPSKYASAKINSIDLEPAQRFPGVKAVWKDESLVGDEAHYIGQILAAVAAETEEIAAEAVKLIKVDYTPTEHQVVDSDSALATGRPSNREEGDVDAAFTGADVIQEGDYGLPAITHCCLEPHGQVSEVANGELNVWPSTQRVTGYVDSLSDPLGIPQNKMHVNCQYMGGGFGSKFGPDKWGMISAVLSKQAGRPVKVMLERDMELEVAGSRPSAYGRFKVGAKQDGTITAMEAKVWGTGGFGSYGMRPQQIPYVFTKIPNTRINLTGVRTNRGARRAWRAPNHPQVCLLTMSALDDTAAALGMDSLAFFKHNLGLSDRPEVYAEQLDIAADLIGYGRKAHLRGDAAAGPVKRGLGIGLHTWGGLGHNSEADVMISADGSVTAECGTQDLGTANRTVMAIVVGETLGLPVEAITVNIGRNSYPASGGSGGSTTVGGVSTACRFAATNALNELLTLAATRLGVAADTLEAREGRIREINHPSNGMSWTDACSLLGPRSIKQRGVNNRGEAQNAGFIDAGVGGVQMADVSVDIDTGVVTINEMVAVQDCGLIIDMKTAESQVLGAMIMGITSALYEEVVYDPATGKMLNADMEFYRLAGIKDVGKLKVHMMTDKKNDDRGVIGLGEPPAISPQAAIANAVANAIGVRVPYLPLTPDRVIGALQKGGIA